MKSNLPPSTVKDSTTSTRDFFNSYYEQGISIPSNDINATVSFFESRGFDLSAASSISAFLLSQSKIENIPVFQLIDTLKGLNGLELSRVVLEILNYNRLNISILGYKNQDLKLNDYEVRNVVP